MTRSAKSNWFTLLLCLVFPVLAFIAVTTGPIEISILNLTKPSSSIVDNQHDFIFFQIRLPRVIAAITVGTVMALAGVVMQGLFRNPLAEPGLLGVSAGAALGAAIAIVVLDELRFSLQGQLLISLFSFIAGSLAVFVVYQLGKTSFGISTVYMLLGGIAINAFGITIVNMLQYFANDVALRDINTWLMGGLHSINYLQLCICIIATLPFLLCLFRYHRALDAFLLGEPEAGHLGINTLTMKKTLLISLTLCVCVCTAFCGVIGFIGLVAPHIVRFIVGPSHRQLLPLSALTGAIILLLSDTLARTVIKPAELPVGLITALIGGPFFFFLLLHYRRQHHD